MSTRRHFTFLCFLWAGVGLFQPTDARGAVDWPQLQFTEIASGMAVPTCIADPGDGTGRLFATEQLGRVVLMQSNSVNTFLDLQNRVQYFPGGELGLLSVAFSPGFATNGHFYVFYHDILDGASIVSRFSISSTNANVGDPSTEERVLTIPLSLALYTLSGGLLLFGPDGFLYVGTGDSGFERDWPNEAQDTRSSGVSRRRVAEILKCQ